MAVMRRELPSGTIRMQERERRPNLWSHPLLSAVLGAVVVIVAYQFLSGALFWAHVKIDDLRYGYPRSYQMEGYVGFGESNGLPTHFIALNLHRQVEVMIVAGDDPTHVTTLKGPALFGDNMEYEPVTLRLVDVTGDGYPDLVLDCARQRVIWVDQPRLGSFRPILPEERAGAVHVIGGSS